MSTQPCAAIKFREFDANGAPLAGGKLYTYAAGTTTPLATYTDASGSVANANPIILDAAGRASVWLQPDVLYKFVLRDSADVVQYTEDNFPSTQTIANTSFAATEPGGRLTLDSSAPVSVTDVVGSNVVYYMQYTSNYIPLYDGTNWSLVAFGEAAGGPTSGLQQLTTDTTKSPAAVAPNSNYDMFVWNDSGIVRLSRGPAWSTTTARGTGVGTTELTQINGRWVNKNAITNGPGAELGLFVGTVGSDGSSLLNDSGGFTNPVQRYVWNQYNRVSRAMQTLETTAFWDYSTSTWRQARAQTTNQLNYLCGMAEDRVEAYVAGLAYSAVVSTAQVGVGVDVTNAPSGLYGRHQFTDNISPVTAHYTGVPGLGRHYLAWLEWAGTGGTVTWYGTSNGQTGIIGSVMA